MANQIVVSAGAKVRNLSGVLTATSGVVSSVPLGAANGVATLDSGGKVPVSQLPSSVVTYLGTWNAATNTPTLVNGTGDAGDMYICNVAGTVNFGAGPVTFAVGDWVLYGSGTWQKSSGQNGTVTSVAITESGDSLNITGSPIVNSGTINIGFNGTNLQYVNGAGNLTTFPILTGYVPYTGATANVDLGVYDLTADLITGATGSFTSNGGSDTFAINHSSGGGIALNITKGGNGEGLYINKTSGSGNAATIIGTLNATALVKSGGTSSQFLKADGTVDSNTYALDSLVVHLAGTETITGAKTFSGYTTFTSTVDITSGLTFSNSGFTLVLQPPTLSVNRTVTLPNGTGTLALTSDLSSYVPYTGATGAVNLGTNELTSGNAKITDTLYLKVATTYAHASGYYGIQVGTNLFTINNSTSTQAAFSLALLTTSRTFTLPDASGTIALVGGSGVGTVTSVAALTIGTTGTDLSSSVANSTTTPVITLNVPTASATNRGALSSADWTTFNNKQSALTNPVTGTGTTNYLPKFTGTSTIGNSIVQDDGSSVTIGGTLQSFNASPIFLFSTATTSNYEVLAIDKSATDARIRVYKSGTGSYRNLIFETGGSTKLTLDASGNLGLGVTPSQQLTVGGRATIQLSLVASNNTGASEIYFGDSDAVFRGYIGYQHNGDYFAFCTSASEKMRLFDDGNLLIQSGGTFTNAGYKLDVNGTGRFSGNLTLSTSTLGVILNAADAPLITRGWDAFTSGTYNGIGRWGMFLENGALILGTPNVSENGSIKFKRYNVDGTSSTTVTIASTGAATFSSSVTVASIYSSGLIQTPDRLYINGQTVPANWISNALAAGYNTSGQQGWIQGAGSLALGTNGVSHLTLASTGAATFSSSVTATSFFESSSIKGKDIIATNPLLALDIDVIKYTRKSDESKDIRYGYSAEQIHSLMPELTDKDVTAVKYLDVHTILISQLQQEIKELKAKMN